MGRSWDQRKVAIILWKRLTLTDAQALLNIKPPAGTGGGAKHIPIRHGVEVDKLLEGLPRTRGTNSEPEFDVVIEGPGGHVKTVSIAYDERGAREGGAPR